MKYLAVLGRQPEISLAELEAIYGEVRRVSDSLAVFVSTTEFTDNINRLGGTLKLAIELGQKPIDYLSKLPDGKITIGVSDYSKTASRRTALEEALKLKKILVRHGRSVRVVESKDAVLATATSLHNGLSGKNERKVELVKVNDEWFRVIGVQDIDAYARRDQARPARDAKVGMLPPKLAQILINLCGILPEGSRILDPFCGTGVVLQEALLMGYCAYGTDINERMIEYSKRNLEWLMKSEIIQSEGIRSLARRGRSPAARGDRPLGRGRPSVDGPAGRGPKVDNFQISIGDATSFKWVQPINAVACEGYLGKPFSRIPSEVELKGQKQECGSIILGFLKNICTQIDKNTPITIAVPAWLREDGSYSRLDILDEIDKLGYNVDNKSREGLLYHREDQVVARDILILRKK